MRCNLCGTDGHDDIACLSNYIIEQILDDVNICECILCENKKMCQYVCWNEIDKHYVCCSCILDVQHAISKRIFYQDFIEFNSERIYPCGNSDSDAYNDEEKELPLNYDHENEIDEW
jgi:hypothetical protein